MPTLKPRSATEFDEIAGGFIRDERKKLLVTQKDLAAKVGVTYQQIQKYETGSNRLTLERFVRICEALGLTPKACLGRVLNRSANRRATLVEAR